MSDIYEKLLRKRDLHITEKHNLNQEEYTTDISCDICYPIRWIGVNEEKEFLKFWDIYCEIVPQILVHGYNIVTIVSYMEIIETYQENFIDAAKRMIWSTQYKEIPEYRVKGLIKVLWIIIRTCIENNDEGLYFHPRFEQVKENVNNDCELQTYGYALNDQEVNERFKRF